MLVEPERLVGTWRRFGLVGPAYEIVGLGEPISDVDRWMRVRVAETEEMIDYKFSDILDDPKER